MLSGLNLTLERLSGRKKQVVPLWLTICLLYLCMKKQRSCGLDTALPCASWTFNGKKKSLMPKVGQVSLCLFLCSNFSYFNLNGRASSSLGFCQLLMSPLRQSMCYWLFLAWKILRAHVVPFSFNCANLVQFSFTQIVFISRVLYRYL